MSDYRDFITGAINSIADKVKTVADKSNVKEIYETGAAKAKTYTSITRLNIEAGRCNEELNKVYLEIGKLFFEQNPVAPDEFYESLFSRVRELSFKLDGLKKDIAGLKADLSAGQEDTSDIDVEIGEFEEIVDFTEEDGRN